MMKMKMILHVIHIINVKKPSLEMIKIMIFNFNKKFLKNLKKRKENH